MEMTESYRRVHYELRPAKQVERRMIIDGLQLLGMAGFPIRDYQYTGMGSIYFVDFILFHRLLGIDRLLSVEASLKIKRRVGFNRPFGLVQLEMGNVGDHIASLSQDLQHILWLDYDNILFEDHLQDLALAGTYLPKGSIVMVTVDVEPPSGKGPSEWREYFTSLAPNYSDSSWTDEHFARSNLIDVNISLLEKALHAGLAGRVHIEPMPIFSFEYADGNRMLTVGAILGGEVEKRNLRASRLVAAPFFREDWHTTYKIQVPKLTRKERLFLDSRMPIEKPSRLREFELTKEELNTYSEIYRYFPAYAELLL